MSPTTTTTTTTTLTCGGCGLALRPAGDLPAECPHCGERLTAPRRRLREAELEDRARARDPRQAFTTDPRRSRPL